MAYHVELLDGPIVIGVRFLGLTDASERSAALEDVVKLQGTTHARALLVDLAQARFVEASNAETFAYATRLARVPVVRDLRIAYVGNAALADSVAALAALRGHGYRRFRSRGAALRWLQRLGSPRVRGVP